MRIPAPRRQRGGLWEVLGWLAICLLCFLLMVLSALADRKS